MKPTAEQLAATILAALASGPKTSADLTAICDVDGCRCANTYRKLLRTGQISRVEKPKGKFTYWIGTTAPGWTGYRPCNREPRGGLNAIRAPMAYPMPVRHIIAPPLPGVHVNKITLPKEPWYSPTSGDCVPALPGKPKAGPVPSIVTKPQGSDRPCGVEGAV